MSNTVHVKHKKNGKVMKVHKDYYEENKHKFDLVDSHEVDELTKVDEPIEPDLSEGKRLEEEYKNKMSSKPQKNKSS